MTEPPTPPDVSSETPSPAGVERPDDSDILDRLRELGVVPCAERCQWQVSSRIVNWNAKAHPRSLRSHVWAWPVSSRDDMQPLADALGDLPGVIEVRPLTDAELRQLRPGVFVYRSTWQYEDFRARGRLREPW